MELRKIRSLMAMVSESGIHDLELTNAEGTIRIVRGDQAVSSPRAANDAVVVAAPSASAPALTVVQAALPVAAVPAPERVQRSPMVGICLRGPGNKSLIKVGDTVRAGQPVCVIRAMKLDTEIKAEQEGVVREVLWEDGEPVQYGQPLFTFEPAATVAHA
jgi:acetyl-CoA carboxylase biotin carboxyl carrier protein